MSGPPLWGVTMTCTDAQIPTAAHSYENKNATLRG